MNFERNDQVLYKGRLDDHRRTNERTPEKWIQKERGGNEFSEKTDLYFYFINDSAQLTTVERTGIQFRFTIPMILAENEIEEEEKRSCESVWEIGRAHV